MEVTISPNLKTYFPKIKIGMIIARDVTNNESDGQLQDEKKKVEAFIRNNYVDISKNATVQGYAKFYKRFGFVENKGRRRDFSLPAGMIRKPQ